MLLVRNGLRRSGPDKPCRRPSILFTKGLVFVYNVLSTYDRERRTKRKGETMRTTIEQTATDRDRQMRATAAHHLRMAEAFETVGRHEDAQSAREAAARLNKSVGR
jgi:hypothetical protein